MSMANAGIQIIKLILTILNKSCSAKLTTRPINYTDFYSLIDVTIAAVVVIFWWTLDQLLMEELSLSLKKGFGTWVGGIIDV
jgi:hypothetical protein